jgi:hypothetical protein
MEGFSFQIFPTPSAKVIPVITVVVRLTIAFHWLQLQFKCACRLPLFPL